MAKLLKTVIFIAVVGLLLILPTLGLKIAKADDVAVTEFDKTYVTDDLNQMKIDGVQFDELDYPVNLNDHNVTLLNLVEYMFTYDEVNRGKYGVYLYFYNPSQKDIIASQSNKIQIADAFDSDGNATSYKKFNLQLINASTAPAEKVFLKFKVVFDKSFIKSLNKNARRYRVSGVELFESNKQNATEYNVSGGWTFSGFAKNCGPDAKNNESTLSVSDYYTIDTISLDVHSTTYRQNGVSHLGAGHQNQVNSVYFAIPNRYLKKNGTLQKIKCEYYEYKTKWIVTTDQENIFNSLKAAMPNVANNGYEIGLSSRRNNASDPTYIKNGKSTSLSANLSAGNITQAEYDRLSEKMATPYLYYVFNSNDKKVTSQELIEYINEYSSKSTGTKLPIKSGEVLENMFYSYVDDGHTKGYNLVEIDAEDSFDLLDYDSNHSGWMKFLQYGFHAPSTDDGLKDIKPIVAVESLYGLSSDNLLVNANDFNKFKNFCTESLADDSTPYLFRFSVSDYESYDATVHKNDSWLTIGGVNSNTTMSSETLYLDFDIITLTFARNGVYTVVPVVSNPVDIVGDITPPLENNESWVLQKIGVKIGNWFNSWGKWLVTALAIVIGIVLIVVFFPVIVAVLKIIGRVIIAPFKAMKRSIDNRSERKARTVKTKKRKNKHKRRTKNAKKRKES